MNDIFRRIDLKLHKGIITSNSKGEKKGRVLLSYTTLPFISPQSINSHSNRWECLEMVKIWNEAGYGVDIVDFNNEKFIPKKHYSYCIDVGHHLERFTPYLDSKCIKIFHISTAHWKFQNEAELKRISDIDKRRGVRLLPRRTVLPSENIEVCDIATILGNDFTESTYAFANKKIIRIPVSTTHTYPSPENKDFDSARKNFVWIGGSGMAHKGLDLVLEAFSDMPDYHLSVFGKKDEDFAKVYEKELFHTNNISYQGMINVASKTFIDITKNSVGIIFPSCSEGSAGSVILGMHAGLIPIVSYQSGIDVEDFGIILKENTVGEIKNQIITLSSFSVEKIQNKTFSCWQYVNKKNTRKSFSIAYSNFVKSITEKIK